MCPFYLSIGMTYEQYWDASPYLVKAYYDADKLRYKRRNEEMWIQGSYIYEAVSVALANSFSKKGGKKYKYSDKPYKLFAETKHETEIDREIERENAIDSLSMFKAKMETKFKGEKLNGSKS